MDAEQIVNDCNKVLRYLMHNAEPDWDTVLKEELSESEYKTNLANVDRMKKKHQPIGGDCIGAVRFGTGQLLDFNNINATDGRTVIKLLKERGSLLQCGRGRGKALVLIHNKAYMSLPELNEHMGFETDAPVGEKPKVIVEADIHEELHALTVPKLEELKAEVENEGGKTNVANLLRDATDEYRHLHQELTECKRLLSQKDARIEELKSENQDLLDKLEQNTLTNWA